jgi:hypothetical protein
MNMWTVSSRIDKVICAAYVILGGYEQADSRNTTFSVDPPAQNWRLDNKSGLTHISIKYQKTKMIFLLCKIPRNTKLKITNQMWLISRLYKNKGPSRDYIFTHFSGFSYFVLRGLAHSFFHVFSFVQQLHRRNERPDIWTQPTAFS